MQVGTRGCRIGSARGASTRRRVHRCTLGVVAVPVCRTRSDEGRASRVRKSFDSSEKAKRRGNPGPLSVCGRVNARSARGKIARWTGADVALPSASLTGPRRNLRPRRHFSNGTPTVMEGMWFLRPIASTLNICLPHPNFANPHRHRRSRQPRRHLDVEILGNIFSRWVLDVERWHVVQELMV
jgi:hypothetical protein